ncbi:MAG: hypothetical protein NC926_09420 [Candidatus Omnitrophica bacterium]|nr:hypothetical protein [Candidatus Omnitrophota bacterium]
MNKAKDWFEETKDDLRHAQKGLSMKYNFIKKNHSVTNFEKKIKFKLWLDEIKEENLKVR